MEPARNSVLDRPAARWVALGVACTMVALLGYIHRDDIFPPEVRETAADDPVALCLAERAQGIDRMAADGTISADQAGLFKSRAEALCQSQFGQSGPPPRQ
jgi:hypothetical protein